LLLPLIKLVPPGNPDSKAPFPKKNPAVTLPLTVNKCAGFSNVTPVDPPKMPASLNITWVFAPAALAITVVWPALKNLISIFASDEYILDANVITFVLTV
jgi:hypothetical protein